jgi:mRNA-degrading endonuclease toxin of MazEF toxin-antitoxin module
MKPWEIWTCNFPGVPGPHPAVILGADDRVQHKPVVNVLLCSSQRANRKAELHEVVLDRADGLNWGTLCKCDLVYATEKSQLTGRRGIVTAERRRAIAQRLIGGLGLAGL